MVGFRVAVALMLVSGLLAGCAGQAPPPAGDDGKSRPQADAVAALGGRPAEAMQPQADARAGPASSGPDAAAGPVAGFQVVDQVAATDAAPWYLAAVAMAKNGDAAVAGFRWTVPSGSVHAHDDYDSIEGVSLEAAFLVPEGESIESYTVSLFVMDGETPTLLGSLAGIPYQYTLKNGPLHFPDQTEVPLDPMLLYFDEHYVRDGTELGLVVSAQGPATAFGFAWRVLDHNVVFGRNEASSSTESFLADAGSTGPGLAMQPRGTGSGHQVAVYADLNLAFVVGLELRGGAVTVTDELPTEAARPTASVRDVSIRSSFQGPDPDAGGWGIAAGIYATGTGAAPWSASGNVHGTSLDESGTAAGPLGFAIFQLLGQEKASSDISFDLTVASADYGEILIFISLDYGAAISTLLGSSAPSDDMASGSSASLATAQQDGRDLVLGETQGPSIRLLGALPLDH